MFKTLRLTTTVSRLLLPVKKSIVVDSHSVVHFNSICLTGNIQRSMSMYQTKMHPLIFRQLFDTTSSTYTYLLADSATKEAVLIDPVYEQVDRDVELVKQLGLKLGQILNTHVHADHVTGSGEIKKHIPEAKSVIGDKSGAQSDVKVTHGEKLKFGNFSIECRSTPGHTNGCMTFVVPEISAAFTGDALLIRGCGRTDFQDGSPEVLFNSVHSQILSLPAHYLLYPAHDYKGKMVTSVEEESKYNPRLTKTKAEFIDIMNNLNLPNPKQIDRAVPANLVCGLFELQGSSK